MKYPNYFLFLLFVSCLLNCSKDNDEPKPTVNSLSSTATFIGDTLTLTGTNLDQITNIKIYDENIEVNSSVLALIVSKNETQVKFIVPELFGEKATVYFSSNLDPIDIELHGYIPYSYETNGSIYRFANATQILNDDIAFGRNVNLNQRFKLINNYSKIQYLPSIDNTDVNSKVYYTDENAGYVVFQFYSYYKVYSFIDNINNRSLEYIINTEDLNTNTFILDLKFISNNLAYLMNENGEMFQILDGVVTSFNDVYPLLNNTFYMSQEYKDSVIGFRVLQDNSIYIRSLRQDYILKIKNGELNMINFSSNTSYYDSFSSSFVEPTFFNNEGGFYSKSEHKIYKSKDYGQTWTAYDVNSANDENIVIEYLGENQFILHSYLINPKNIDLKSKYISTDNGNSWRRIFHSSREGYGGNVSMHNEYGLTSSSTYGLVKFRRFPSDF